jgi:probable rRNA maturation factor
VSHVLVRCTHREGRAAAKRLRGRAREFLDALGLDEAELSLSIVGDAEIRELNCSWRGKDSATDVLSFPLDGRGAGPMLGDVVISFDTATRVAREDRRELDAELDRYLAHGILHLTGHDHVSARQARDMAAAEERLLSAAGMVAATLAPARRSAGRGGVVRRSAGGTTAARASARRTAAGKSRRATARSGSGRPPR